MRLSNKILSNKFISVQVQVAAGLVVLVGLVEADWQEMLHPFPWHVFPVLSGPVCWW
jgi:hypothetical protein